MGIYITHQGEYLPEILLIMHESLVDTSHTRSMVHGRSQKGILDKSNNEGTLRKSLNKQERAAENLKGILNDNVDQGMLHGEHHLLKVRSEHQICG